MTSDKFLIKRSRVRHHNLSVARVEPHQRTNLLIRSITALNLPVTPLLHADTGAVLTGELVVIAGSHCHVPGVVRATGVIVDLPCLGTEHQGPCRGRAHRLEILVLAAPRIPLGSYWVKPSQSIRDTVLHHNIYIAFLPNCHRSHFANVLEISGRGRQKVFIF